MQLVKCAFCKLINRNFDNPNIHWYSKAIYVYNECTVTYSLSMATTTYYNIFCTFHFIYLTTVTHLQTSWCKYYRVTISNCSVYEPVLLAVTFI